jgi:hypothetical protein
MKLQNIKKLNEAPLPPDWDKEKFKNSKVLYRDMISYAKEKADDIGQGSSRVAFLVPYEGRKTVIKIAKNRLGISQNIEEIKLLNNQNVKKLNIVIPIIDYDKDNKEPSWIHTEYADMTNEDELDNYFGYYFVSILKFIDYYVRGENSMFGERSLPKRAYQNKYFKALLELVKSNDLPIGDFGRIGNWGVYNNHPVVIDLGLTSNTVELYKS